MLNTKSLMRLGAVAASAALVGMGISPAAAHHDATSYGMGDAVVGTGLFASVESLITEGFCEATNNDTEEEGTQTGNCTPSIDLNPAQVITQTASADPNGISSAEAGTAEVPISDLPFALDISDILAGLGSMSSGTLLAALGPILDQLGNLLAPLTTALDDALGPVLDAVQSSLPLSVSIGAVFSECSATPETASGSAAVAGIDISLELGGQQIAVPITLDTAPNSRLLVGAPQDLVNALLDGISATLTESLDGALGPLITAIVSVQEVVNSVLDALEPALLQPLADLLSSVIDGWVNLQSNQPGYPYDATGANEVDVTALELTLLGNNTLGLANVHCGINTAGTPHEEPETPEEPEVPTVIDAGSGGAGAGLVAALALLGAAAGIAGHRVRRSLI